MTTFNRVCIKDFCIEAASGAEVELKRGHEYLTSEERNKKVVVFSTYWVEVPVELFAGEVQFT